MATGNDTPEYDDYWNEFNDIERDKDPDEEVEISKTPDEGEQEAAWLKDAGYGFVLAHLQDGKELSEDEIEALTSSLTKRQAEAVKKRVDTLTISMRKTRQTGRLDVREIFPTGQLEGKISCPNHLSLENVTLNIVSRGHMARGNTSPPKSPGSPLSDDDTLNYPVLRRHSSKHREKGFMRRGGNYSMSGVFTAEIPEDNHNPGVAMLSINPKSSVSPKSRPISQLALITEGDIALDFRIEESHTNGKVSGSKSSDDNLPNVQLLENKLGITQLHDLGAEDMGRIRSLALIELTSLFDTNNLTISKRKVKKKPKDHGIFGVSLHTLIEQDQKYNHHVTVPLIFQQIVHHLNRVGLDAEGILRVPGSAGRIKQIREELESSFYQGMFPWKSVMPNDAAGLLKQFLRELPTPILTCEYIDSFAQVLMITEIEQKLKALNLLIALLPENNRNVLKVLLIFLNNVVTQSSVNKMSLNNVSMIMAPNLFLTSSGHNKVKRFQELELQMAAGTSNIVKMLIKYHEKLWIVPSSMIMQIRHQYEMENARKNRESRKMKVFGKKADRMDIYKKAAPLHEGDFQDGVIRVQAPHLTKSCTAIQLDDDTTAGDVVNRFRRFTPSPKDTGDFFSSKSNRGSFLNPDNGLYAEANSFLYEVGGNIGERRLDHLTNMKELYATNPNAEWIIKKYK